MVGSKRTRRLGNFFCCRGNGRPGADGVRHPKDRGYHSPIQSSGISGSDLLVHTHEGAEEESGVMSATPRNARGERRSRYSTKSVQMDFSSEEVPPSAEADDIDYHRSQLVTQVHKDSRLALYPQSGDEDPQDLLRLHEQFRSPLLGPQRPLEKGKKTLVLDLDETLVHSSFQPVALAAFVLPVEIESLVYEIYVAKRPGVDDFLEFCTEHYEVVIFTASVGKYAGPLLDRIDPEGKCPWRLYRDSCLLWQGNYIKDLSKLGRDLKNVLIVDNSPASSILQPDNAIPIRSWYDDQNDRELYELMPILKALSCVNDIQAVMRRTATCESNESEEADF